MESMRLVVFDIDGTLTRSSDVDGSCYERALSAHLPGPIDTAWANYRHQTDAGVLNELIERHEITDPNLVAVVRKHFLRLLAEQLTADPECCREVPGARRVLAHLSGMSGVHVAIATGAWADSARLKLRHAELPFQGLPLASSDDAASREEILRTAVRRAAAQAGAPFECVTYVGDQPWDLRAAQALGAGFVGVASDGCGAALRATCKNAVVFADFTDQDAFVQHLLAG